MSGEDRVRLDRRLSLALIFAVVVEGAGALMWAGAAAERIDQLEGRAVDTRAVYERLARLEEQVAQARGQLDRIEARIDAR
jgi:hypothetical protein